MDASIYHDFRRVQRRDNSGLALRLHNSVDTSVIGMRPVDRRYVRWERMGRNEYLIEVLPKSSGADSVRWRVLGVSQPTGRFARFVVTDIACTDIDPPISLHDFEGTYASVGSAFAEMMKYLDPDDIDRLKGQGRHEEPGQTPVPGVQVVFEPAMLVISSVQSYGAELVLSPDGRLRARYWEQIPPDIQAEVRSLAFEIVATLCQQPAYRLSVGQIEELRDWVVSGALDDIPASLISLPGVIGRRDGPAIQTAYWLRRFDLNGGHPRDEARLREIFYGVLAYRHRQEQR